MSQSSFESENDQDIKTEVTIEFTLTQMADMIRDQLIKDSRRIGNLYGSTAAQKKTPLASKPQNPGTQRVW
jgi:uncharacterized protein YajQ (UPF0234 family)